MSYLEMRQQERKRLRFVYESVRVKEAKENGGDVLEAMYEDALRVTSYSMVLSETRTLIESEIFEKKESS